MKFLLDTHTLIWWDSEPQRLSQQVLNICQDPENVATGQRGKSLGDADQAPIGQARASFYNA